MLLGNFSVFHKNPARYRGGTTLAENRCNFNNSSSSRNIFVSQQPDTMAKFYGLPVGYTPPYTYIIPRMSGGVASRNLINGSGDISFANLAGGLNAEATILGVGDIVNANLALVVSAVATLLGTGSLSADVVGKLEASATLAGSGDLTGSLGALANAVASIIGTGSVTNGDLRAIANVSANIIVGEQGVLTPQGLASALWNAVASEYNSSGTMGNKLNSAASGGVDLNALADAVWDEDLSTHTTTGSAGKLVDKASKPKISL